MSLNCLFPRMVSATFYFSLQIEVSYFCIFLLSFYGLSFHNIFSITNGYNFVISLFSVETNITNVGNFVWSFSLCFRAFVRSLWYFIWLQRNCVFIVSRVTYSHRRAIWMSVGWGTIYLIPRRYIADIHMFEKGPQQHLSQGSSTSVSMNPESITVMSGPFIFIMINQRVIAF